MIPQRPPQTPRKVRSPLGSISLTRVAENMQNRHERASIARLLGIHSSKPSLEISKDGRASIVSTPTPCIVTPTGPVTDDLPATNKRRNRAATICQNSNREKAVTGGHRRQATLGSRISNFITTASIPLPGRAVAHRRHHAHAASMSALPYPVPSISQKLSQSVSHDPHSDHLRRHSDTRAEMDDVNALLRQYTAFNEEGTYKTFASDAPASFNQHRAPTVPSISSQTLSAPLMQASAALPMPAAFPPWQSPLFSEPGVSQDFGNLCFSLPYQPSLSPCELVTKHRTDAIATDEPHAASTRTAYSSHFPYSPFLDSSNPSIFGDNSLEFTFTSSVPDSRRSSLSLEGGGDLSLPSAAHILPPVSHWSDSSSSSLSSSMALRSSTNSSIPNQTVFDIQPGQAKLSTSMPATSAPPLLAHHRRPSISFEQLAMIISQLGTSLLSASSISQYRMEALQNAANFLHTPDGVTAAQTELRRPFAPINAGNLKGADSAKADGSLIFVYEDGSGLASTDPERVW
ncbi:hypothetical protein EMMF5_002108 [Cystobasidiomycetes sp. EMM_F5]